MNDNYLTLVYIKYVSKKKIIGIFVAKLDCIFKTLSNYGIY